MLNLKNISFSYAREKIFNDINVQIDTTLITAVAGRNGTGKTTLTRLIMGLMKPDAGTIELNGKIISDMPSYILAKDIGYVFQNPDHQLFASSVHSEAAYAPLALGMDIKLAEENVQQALIDTELADKQECMPQLLSLGDKQRLSIASALAAVPKLLILDEPTSGQDCRERTVLLRLMRKLNKKGIGIILITHDMDILAEHADRVLVLSNKCIAFEGTPRELFTDEERTAALGLELPEAVRISHEMKLELCLTPAELYNKIAVRREENGKNN
ncbi:energy-coupling factor ABC transporter ATP-binding protein [Pectinatus haikarae]|uniref:Energy-coupling factor transport system ATP-binding protein n=1 Tax=Pectinatus haikarae TaxID=349096 RepID=A0ABT9Y516_9FIRM|nr:ABC transporter ATP-binding protein [Pectinatus haikarae]MDQ0202923.1 energy-coupling factor transport system ATP-binding protein [Pectinatus haikarae]